MFYTSDFKNIIRHLKHRSESRTFNNQRRSDGEAQKRKWTFTSSLYELLDEYCKFGSLHGLRYIRDSSIPRIERLLWLGIFLTCLYISGIVVWSAYLTAISNEFQLVYNPVSSPIWSIPFPAVLVCSAYPIRRSFFDLSKGVNNTKFKHFSKLICQNKQSFESEVFNDTIDNEFFDFVRDAAIPCEKLIVNCYWCSKKKDCCSLFKPIITKFGLCHVFNSLPGEVIFRDYNPPPGVEVLYDDNLLFWDIEKGYPEREGRVDRVRPSWVKSGGPLKGLTFDLVNVKEEWQFSCSGSYTGFQLYIYPPDGVPDAESFMRIPYNVHSYIKLKPNLITSEESLRSVDLDERECLFKDEIHLEYFNFYSQSACEIECLVKTSLRLCGCVPFTFQKMVGRFGYPYCNYSSGPCLLTVFDQLTDLSMAMGYKKTGFQTECLCFPDCSWLSYDLQSSFQKISDLNGQPPWTNNYIPFVSKNEDTARLSIFFSEQQFNSIKRMKTSDLFHKLGDCGGLLGLLLGFSFMSFLEVIYFAVIQPVRKIFSWITYSERQETVHALR